MTCEEKIVKVQTQTRQPIVYMILDISGSMTGDPLRQGIKGCVNLASKIMSQGYQVGFITFGSFSSLRTKPIEDLVLLRSYIEEIHAEGSTNMAAGLFDAYISLKPMSNTPTTLLVITDGHADDEKETLDVARAIKTRNIRILTLGTEDANFPFLEKLATTKELAQRVPSEALQEGIESMVKLILN